MTSIKKRVLAGCLCLMMLFGILSGYMVSAEGLSNLQVSSTFDVATSTLKMTWETANTAGYTAKEIHYGNMEYPIGTTADGQALLSLSNPVAGTYTATLVFQPTGGGNEISVPVPFTITLADEMGFTFKETTASREFNSTTGVLKITWNQSQAPAGTRIRFIKIGNKSYEASETGTGKTVVTDLTDLYPGKTDFSYILSSNGKDYTIPAALPLIKSGRLNTKMRVTVENDYIFAYVTDEYDRPIQGYKAVVKVGNETSKVITADANGKLVFNIFAPEDLSTVLCVGEEQVIDTVTYSSISQGIGGIGTIPTTTSPSQTSPTDTTTSPTTTGTNPQNPTGTVGTTVAPTSPLIHGAGTTGKEDTFVSVNVSYDSNLLTTFGLTKTEFESRARLLMSQEVYAAIVHNQSDILMLAARTSARTVNADQISTLTHGISKYSSYDSSKVLALTADLQLQMIENGTETFLPISEVANISYTVQFPVPKSATSATLFAAAEVTETGFGPLIDATLENGFIRFTVPKMGHYVLLGFVESSAGGAGNDVPVLLVVLIIIGVLLLVGAGLLLFFFVIRKPKDNEDDDPSPDDELTGFMPLGSREDFSDVAYDSTYSIKKTADEETAPSDVGVVPLVPGESAPPVAQAPLFTEDDRDIYSSDSKRPGGQNTDTDRGVSLGSFQTADQGSANASSKKPSDYDIDL